MVMVVQIRIQTRMHRKGKTFILIINHCSLFIKEDFFSKILINDLVFDTKIVTMQALLAMIIV